MPLDALMMECGEPGSNLTLRRPVQAQASIAYWHRTRHDELDRHMRPGLFGRRRLAI